MESAARTHPVATENEEATEAWSGVLFDRFVSFRELIVTGFAEFSDEALRLHPPNRESRVLDIGCGFGDTTRRLAGMVGAESEALGVDVAEPFVEAAIAEAAGARVENVRFMAGDVQVMDLPGTFDCVFSRMGVMFFANPVAALRNLREAMAPGGQLCAVVWHRKLDNQWLHRAEESGEPPPRGARGDPRAHLRPRALLDGGRRHGEQPDPDRGVRRAGVHALRPAAEAGRRPRSRRGRQHVTGPGRRADSPCRRGGGEDRATLEREIREVLADFEREDGSVYADASTWVVTATAP